MGVSPHCKTKQMGENIGSLIGKFEAAEFYEYPGKKVIIKIKVAIDINKHILFGIHVGNPTDGTNWIDYRYEKLPQICFRCGMIGHTDNLCRNQSLDLITLAPLGPRIRSTQYGRRKMAEKDKKYYSYPSHAKNFGHYSPPVPEDLLAKLAAMKVQTNISNQPKQQQYEHHHTNPLYSINSPMEGITTQQEMSTQEPQHMITNFVTQDRQCSMETQTPTKDQSTQLKRQRREDKTGAGLAMQAGPRK
jgi:hypothetical protein